MGMIPKAVRYLIGLVLLIKASTGDHEPAYLKVCGKEHKHFLDSFQCEKGLWLRKPIEPGCLCVRGVWALSSGFCDDNAAILVGDGNCFHVPFEIHSVKLIGDSKDPFKPKVYHLPRSADAVHELKEGVFTPPLQNDETMLVAVNPRQVAQRKDKKICVDLEPSDYDKPVHIYLNPRRVEKEWTLDKKKHYNCPNVVSYEYHVGFGEMFTRGRVEPRLMVTRDCTPLCPGEVGDTLVPPNANASRIQGRWLSHTHKSFKTIEERNQEREEMRAKFTELPAHYEKEVNEQTLRMMHAHISPILLNLSTKHVVTHEYRYFQQIRKVVEKACPQEYVPKLVILGLMRMFRQLLWETQDSFFQHVQNNNQGQFDRIMERLKECEEKSPEPSVLFATFSESFKPKNDSNKTEDLEPPPERCPVPLIYAINGTAYNRTDIDKENLYIKDYPNIFQPHLKFNASQVDFVIETAWKVAMIGHYRCSKYFDDQTAIEFSHFFSQIQSFFNPRIIKRWYYTNSVDATYDIVKMVFPSYDLKKFMFGLDSCLFGIQGFSLFDYSNVWLQRPKQPMTDDDLSQKKFVLPGSGTKLSTLDYAPDPPNAKPSGSAPAAAAAGSTALTTAKPAVGGGKGNKSKTAGRRRRKRDVKVGEARGYHLWNQMGRCLDNYMDPVRRKEFGYRLPRGCITPEPLYDNEMLI